MQSRPLLILANIVAITVTIAAFVQAISWTIAGILILVSLTLPLLVSLAPARAQPTPHTTSNILDAGHRTNDETKLQQESTEKPSFSNKQSVTKTGPRQFLRQQAMTPLSHSIPEPISPLTGTWGVSPPRTISSPRLSTTKQGPNLNPTIAKDDYTEYDVELEAGKSFLGEVEADGLVNVYLLDEDNMDNLDGGEEFWSETGEEGVETAKLEFTAPSKGKWFFVVENVDDRAITATVKLQKGPSSKTLS